MKAYVVQHVHQLGENSEDVKFIGVYSTEAIAEAAINRMRQKPGFSNAPNGFHVDEYEVDRDYWEEGYVESEG